VQASICSELLRRVAKHRPALVRAMAAAGEVDCLVALATAARERTWCRPVLTADNVLHISQGGNAWGQVEKPLNCAVLTAVPCTTLQGSTCSQSW